MRAHSSQMAPDGPFFAHGGRRWAQEFLRIAKGSAAPAEGEIWESDLFAGLGI
jgi:hypothetical protein